MLLGFADLISARGRLQCNLIVLDEVQSFCSTSRKGMSVGDPVLGLHRQPLLAPPALCSCLTMTWCRAPPGASKLMAVNCAA